MADEVEMIPVTGEEAPKADSQKESPADSVATLKLTPVVRKPTPGGMSPSALKPGVKLPPKPGLPAGLKLPPKPGLPTGLKLPPKPGLKLPTQTALKPGVKLPPKPVIRKPGEAAAETALPKPMEQLKTVTQKLKGITQEVPQQAILHKTGIIAEGGASDVQKEAAKHKTARISLSDAMGVAPVKNEAAPMKTIRIKRPINIPGATATLKPPAQPDAAAAAPAAQPVAPVVPAADAAAAKPASAAPSATVTQRKTLKITRPGATPVRPGGKFGIKRPAHSAAVAKPASPAAAGEAAAAADGVADIPDIPTSVAAFPPPVAAPVDDSPSWVWTLSSVVQFAACVAIGALAWFLYENSQLPTYCGGLGWGQ